MILNLPAFSFLHSAHDDAVMTARRFRRGEVRALLNGAGFKIERVSYWTTLLFPMAAAARMFDLLKSGRDFESGSKPLASAIFGGVMSVERALLRLTNLPFGVALMAAARKSPL